MSAAGALLPARRRLFWSSRMKTEKVVSEVSLRRLMSEIAVLREQVARAERVQVESQVELPSAIVAAQSRLQSRSGRPL